MSKPDGGPAFPSEQYVDMPGQPVECQVLLRTGGMSLRDWFAGQALIGWLSAPGELGHEARTKPDVAAAWSLESADELLKAREES